ncbi:glycoside hydrolase family 13 protein [Hydnum rufescens UP504]|uniref:alpha-amylase n=1 Tax=Hydnum rufescens UP504 TaxID=1448309 RepID=A0A9P6DSP5_9AGAM|nr:glycoside hydrolase family 13 protein [Hydnum rufescens UP504]
MFQWNWESIAHECATWLHKTGYGYVQISPPQEHIQGPQWWTDYQPVSYKLISKRGNSLQFQKMVKACHGSNIKIITDTIWNHMAGIDGIGTGGTNFSHYNYPGIYGYSDFHHCVNNTARFEVQNCELVNLADLATGTEVVRGTLADYADTLIYLGADGLRLDAAKLIPADDIHAILAHMKNPPSIVTQEVVWGAQEEIQPTEYLQNGKVHEFRYPLALRDAFLNIDQRGWLPSNQSNVFVANHDTERTGTSLNYTSPNNIYTLAHIFMFAYPYGHPYSTHPLPRSHALRLGSHSPSGNGSCNVTSGWLCQHRLYAGMVSFYNYVNRNGTYEPITNYISPSPDMIAFGRGSVGHVVINSGPRKWNTTFKTSLPDGKYCDVVEKPMFSTECSDAS